MRSDESVSDDIVRGQGSSTPGETFPREMFLKFVLFTERFANIGDYGWNLTSEDTFKLGFLV